MKYLIRILVFLALPLFAVPLHGLETEKGSLIRVGIYDYDPLNFINKSGNVCGLYPDLIREIARNEGWAIAFVPGSWVEGLVRLQRGEIDLMTAIASSPERYLTMDFNENSVFDQWGQVFFLSGNTFESISDLQGFTVAVVEQDINGQNFLKTIEKLKIQCTILPLTSPKDVFLSVQRGDAAAGVTAQYFGLKHASEFGLVASPIQFAPFSSRFAVKKGDNKHLLERIDAYMTPWKQDKDSFFYKRLAQWLWDKPNTHAILPKWVPMAVGAIAAILVLLAYINRTLNRTVKKRTRELRSREKQYRDLVESANSIILRMDKHGSILFLNRFGLNLFGYTRDEIYGRNVINTLATVDRAHAKQLSYALKETTFTLPEAYAVIENQTTRKDGREVCIQWSNKAITDDRGRFQEILSIGTDITQRRQLEASLYQAQKMEAIGTLAGGIAHDFNNILSVIFGYTELARLSIHNPKKIDEALNQITKGGERARELVSQILTFSRKSETAKQPLLPSLIVKETIKLLRPSLPATITVKTTLTSNHKIEADATQIQQIIMNLCTNAYHSMESTGGTLGIAIRDIHVDADGDGSQPPPGDHVQLEIKDTGSGIPSDALPKIFDPYFTTKAKGKGTGLGLSVVHGIVKEHKGHIQAWSLPGEGTTFQVSFPVARRSAYQTDTGETANPARGGSESILVVDDEAEIATILGNILGQHGYKVQTFTTGEEALTAFRGDPDAFDLIITDLTMPGMTGSQLARTALALRPNLPIILCSGFNDLSNCERTQKIDITDFLQKPVTSDTLLRCVRTHLDNRTSK